MSIETECPQINEDLPVEWSVFYGQLHPEKRFPVVVAAVVAFGLGLLILNNLVMAILAVLVVVFSTAELFLPWKFKIDQEGAEVKIGLSRSVMLWKDVKRAILRNDVLLLSPLQTASRMDVFRGVRLRFSGNSDQILVTISQLLKENGCVLDRGTDTGTAGRTDGEDAKSD